MLVMFAVGVMNVVWMIALGMIMAAEKLTTTPRLSRIVGAAFIAIGLGFLFAYVEINWPVWSRIESV
jgi:predicted metal-binding membrane protein